MTATEQPTSESGGSVCRPSVALELWRRMMQVSIALAYFVLFLNAVSSSPRTSQQYSGSVLVSGLEHAKSRCTTGVANGRQCFSTAKSYWRCCANRQDRRPIALTPCWARQFTIAGRIASNWHSILILRPSTGSITT